MAEIRNVFIHHVFFWLKNPGSTEDLNQLIGGLRKLSAAKAIVECHIGKPADTSRDVIERTYALSWFVLFKSPADQESYQTDPVHLKFVEECSHLWERVKVHDSIDA